ncbi:MAG: sigma-70 family RNA polymerase sigma factor [bacterium]|nr:sigma-70 family RNA polymerase sigma factor [bacterium]
MDALTHPGAELPGTHAAEDCTQTAAAALWEAWVTWDAALKMHAVTDEDAVQAERDAETAAIHAVHNWLYAAIKTPAKHLYIDQYREDGGVDIVDVTADMRNIVNHVYTESLVSLCFAALTPRQRDICKAFFVEGYSIAVIAHRFHTTENAVKQTIHKSRDKFDRVRAEYDAE